MRYFNKDYANFIVNDEKEKQLISERDRRMNWRSDPKLKLQSQQRLVKYGKPAIAFWIFWTLCYLALTVDYYFKTKVLTIGTILYGVCSICGVILIILYYFELKKARSDIAKAEVKA